MIAEMELLSAVARGRQLATLFSREIEAGRCPEEAIDLIDLQFTDPVLDQKLREGGFLATDRLLEALGHAAEAAIAGVLAQFDDPESADRPLLQRLKSNAVKQANNAIARMPSKKSRVIARGKAERFAGDLAAYRIERTVKDAFSRVLGRRALHRPTRMSAKLRPRFEADLRARIDKYQGCAAGESAPIEPVTRGPATSPSPPLRPPAASEETAPVNALSVRQDAAAPGVEELGKAPIESASFARRGEASSSPDAQKGFEHQPLSQVPTAAEAASARKDAHTHKVDVGSVAANLSKLRPMQTPLEASKSTILSPSLIPRRSEAPTTARADKLRIENGVVVARYSVTRPSNNHQREPNLKLQAYVCKLCAEDAERYRLAQEREE